MAKNTVYKYWQGSLGFLGLKGQWPCLCRSGPRSRNIFCQGHLISWKSNCVEADLPQWPNVKKPLVLQWSLGFLELKQHRVRLAAVAQGRETVVTKATGFLSFGIAALGFGAVARIWETQDFRAPSASPAYVWILFVSRACIGHGLRGGAAPWVSSKITEQRIPRNQRIPGSLGFLKPMLVATRARNPMCFPRSSFLVRFPVRLPSAVRQSWRFSWCPPRCTQRKPKGTLTFSWDLPKRAPSGTLRNP